MKLLYITLLLLLTNLMIVVSQTPEADSLKRLLEQSHPDSSRLLLQVELAQNYIFYHPDSAIILVQQTIQNARRLPFAKGEARALIVLGRVLALRGELPQALETQFHALQISRTSRDREGEAISLISIGSIYVQLSEYRQGLRYFQQALKIDERLNSTNIFALSGIGDAYEKMNQLDSALLFQRQAYEMQKRLPRVRGPLGSLILTRLGLIQARLGNNSGALRNYQDALENAFLTGDLLNQGRTQYRIAELYDQLHEPDSSLYYARLAFFSGQQVSQKKTVLDACNLLSKLFKAKNQLDSAFHYQELTMAAKDSLYGPEKFQRLQLLTSTEQQRQQEILQAQGRFENKIRLYSLLATIGVFLLLAIILYRNNRQKQKANALLHYQKSEIQNTLTELKSTQSQLIQQEKMASLGELTAGIAHEIQNPLNFVNNFSEVNKELLVEMKDEIDKGNMNEVKAIANDIIDNQEKINHHGKRADAIVKGMLQHSRSSSGQKEQTDINALADEYLRLAYHGLRAKDKSFNATLETDYDASIGKIDIIPQDIGRVILNLITNAFYAVTEKKKQIGDAYQPTVSVNTKKLHGKVEIKVVDNGMGISQKVMDKIFQPFFTTKPTGQGTGLGLSLSYDIIKAHGGELKVESKEAEFTEFVVSLPFS